MQSNREIYEEVSEMSLFLENEQYLQEQFENYGK